MKKQKFILLLFVAILFFGSAISALALEVNYPGLSKNPDLPTFVSYLFKIGIALAGISAAVSFAIGGVQLIMSLDNAEASSNAKGRMKSAVLGLILTAASVIIIQTINPQLANITITPPGQGTGVFLKGGGDDIAAERAVSNTSSLPSGYNSLKYVCGRTGGPKLIVWTYPKEGFKGNGDNFEGVKTTTISCGGQTGISGKSFKWAYEFAGVYFYMEGGCSGYSSEAFNGDQGKIMDEFKQKIKSVKIVNDASASYGIVLHEQEGLENGGFCSYPITSTGCQNVNIKASAADIFVINTKEPTTSGDGVDFFSEPYGWDSGAEAGFYQVAASEIKDLSLQVPSKMCFEYEKINRPDEYKYRCTDSKCGSTSYACSSNKDCYEGETCDLATKKCISAKTGKSLCSNGACETFGDCPGSIKIKGSYLVGLYSQQNNNQIYCQTFKRDVENLNTEAFIAMGSEALDKIYIIPIK